MMMRMKHPGCSLYSTVHSVHRIADDGFSSRAFCTPLGAEAGAGLTRWVTPACCTLNIEHCVLHIAYCTCSTCTCTVWVTPCLTVQTSDKLIPADCLQYNAQLHIDSTMHNCTLRHIAHSQVPQPALCNFQVSWRI